MKTIPWGKLSEKTKILTALVPTTAVWVVLYLLKKQPITELWPSLLAGYGQSVGLAGVKGMHDELKKNLGVKLTLPRLYQVMTTTGYFLYTLSQWAITNTGVGRVYFAFNVIFTIAHAYMLYLTLVYNGRLEDPRLSFEKTIHAISAKRYTVNVPAIVGWIGFLIVAGYIWMNEARAAVSSASFKNEILASLGFLMQSIATLRAGFRTAYTSVPDITPFAGAATVAISRTLSFLSLLPLWKKSPVARIFVAGYASVVYSVILNAYYAFKEEKKHKFTNVAKLKAKL